MSATLNVAITPAVRSATFSDVDPGATFRHPGAATLMVKRGANHAALASDPDGAAYAMEESTAVEIIDGPVGPASLPFSVGAIAPADARPDYASRLLTASDVYAEMPSDLVKADASVRGAAGVLSIGAAYRLLRVFMTAEQAQDTINGMIGTARPRYDLKTLKNRATLYGKARGLADAIGCDVADLSHVELSDLEGSLSTLVSVAESDDPGALVRDESSSGRGRKPAVFTVAAELRPFLPTVDALRANPDAKQTLSVAVAMATRARAASNPAALNGAGTAVDPDASGAKGNGKADRKRPKHKILAEPSTATERVESFNDAVDRIVKAVQSSEDTAITADMVDAAVRRIRDAYLSRGAAPEAPAVQPSEDTAPAPEAPAPAAPDASELTDTIIRESSDAPEAPITSEDTAKDSAPAAPEGTDTAPAPEAPSKPRRGRRNASELIGATA